MALLSKKAACQYLFWLLLGAEILLLVEIFEILNICSYLCRSKPF